MENVTSKLESLNGNTKLPDFGEDIKDPFNDTELTDDPSILVRAYLRYVVSRGLRLYISYNLAVDSSKMTITLTTWFWIPL